jgi:hypothetical protein
MRAGEECSHCYHCKLAALWGRADGMIGQLWTDCSCGEPGSVGSVMNVSGSGSLREVAQFYNHISAILTLKNVVRHISVTAQKLFQFCNLKLRI